MPMAVFMVGNVFGTESYTSDRALNMVVVTIGVAIAAYGEVSFLFVECCCGWHLLIRLVLCVQVFAGYKPISSGL